MSAQEHPVFSRPAQLDAPVWRYIDVAKYLSMLQSRALFFSRLDRLGDPFEGSLPRANIESDAAAMEEMFRSVPTLSDDEKRRRLVSIRESSGLLGRAMTRWCAVNCWHINGHESAAMWETYARAGAGVAVRSTFDRLRRSFDQSPTTVYLGTVEYIDYAADFIPPGNLFSRVLRKRKSFEHERELRAVVCQMGGSDQGLDFDYSPWEIGLNIEIDLQVLVERVHVSPTAPAWFAAVIRDATSRYGFDWDVTQSGLLEKPLF